MQNYIYCEEHGMEKHMKFTMFEKETKDKKYHNNLYRTVKLKKDDNGNLVCPYWKNAYINMTNIYVGTNMVKRKKFMSVKNVVIVLTKQNVVLSEPVKIEK